MFDTMLERKDVACYRKTESMWKLNNQVVECGFMHKPCSTNGPTEMPVLAIQKHIIRFFSVSVDAVMEKKVIDWVNHEHPLILTENVCCIHDS
ncbi:uncharacterized protein LOC121767553 isoform X10 [Salvia splendens]|uniref:uncharacterized protein LOC121767553 isoform X10 n=1 Tax=Salvia splendens TaxID=180675 RepID=UPI001C254C97|nr:uncharacterized protein LOC121767553 isoform X10 [Salvia splendens]